MTFIKKIMNYEYWPTSVLYGLIFPNLLFYAWKARSLSYFTNVNPILIDSGMIHYNKTDLLKYMPNEVRPKMWIVKRGDKIEDLGQYPVICKPEKGERGKGVEKIKDFKALNHYLDNALDNTIIEEFITLPKECGVFYVNIPKKAATITSLTFKEFMKVKGDGNSTVKELMNKILRYRLQIKNYNQTTLSYVPFKDQEITLCEIGNHCRGTEFINANKFINKELTDLFEKISTGIPNFNYGRYDLKYNSFEELCKGQNFKIIELNGVNSEPTHIYDQSTGLIQSLKDILFHWKTLVDISKHNRLNGHKPMGAIPFLTHLFKRQSIC